MALTKIDDRGLKTPIDLLDSEKIRFGTGNDLELYHDGSNGWLKNSTNTLILGSDLLELKNEAGTETYLKGTANASTSLYYDNTLKAQTMSWGWEVFGNIHADDDCSLNLGTSNDLRIYHDGSNSYIKDAGTGYLVTNADQIHINNADNSDNMIKAVGNSNVALYFDGARKLETFSSGVQLDDNLVIKDSKKAFFGDGYDLQIYHDNSHSFIRSHTGNLYIGGADGHDGNIVIQATYGEESIWAKHNGAVELYYDNSKKLETQANGITITQGHGLFLADSGKIFLGAGNDYQIYHDGSKSHLKNSTGAIEYSSVDHKFFNAANNSEYARIDADGIKFNGDSTSANALDDYEEGTFTPTIHLGISAQSYYDQYGHYIKIGNKVHLDFYIRVDNANANGNQYAIGNFPFNLKSANHIRGGGCSTYWNLEVNSSYGSNDNVVSLYGEYGNNFAQLWQGDVTARGTSGTSLNGKYFIGFFEYICA